MRLPFTAEIGAIFLGVQIISVNEEHYAPDLGEDV